VKEGKLADIRARLETSPSRSLKRLAQETSVSITFERRATKVLQLRRCKTRVVHALKEHDPLAKILLHFSNWFLHSVKDGEVYPELVFFSDESWFLYVER
jgi:hypothetical protein